VERFMPLALHLARRYPSGAEREDVAQVAALALVKAVDRFDPEMGVAFTSFATPTILGEIKRYFRDYGWSVRTPRALQDLMLRVERLTGDLTAQLGRSPTPSEVAQSLDVSVERVLEALASASAHRPLALEPTRDGNAERYELAADEERGFARVDDALAVDSMLDLLPERDRVVVELRFRHDLLQREIADLLELSQMQISRILTHAIATLRELAAASDEGRRSPS
jgi:RNA polymerase sigma-B factor